MFHTCIYMVICICNASCENEDIQLSTNPPGTGEAIVSPCLWSHFPTSEIKIKMTLSAFAHSFKVNMFLIIFKIKSCRCCSVHTSHWTCTQQNVLHAHAVMIQTQNYNSNLCLQRYMSLSSPVFGTVLLPSLCALNNIFPSLKNASDGPL